MRLSVQGCLILWLCLLSTEAFSAWDYQYGRDQYRYGTARESCEAWLTDVGQSYDHIDMHDPSEPNAEGRYSQGCTAKDQFDRFLAQVTNYYKPEQCNEAWQHEKNPITGEQPLETCTCANGWEDAGEDQNPRCQLPDQTPEECKENGQVHNPSNGLCELECEHGQLNGACLPPPEEPNECNSDSPDYRGQIVQGYGKSPINFCGDIDQCSGDKPGQIGLVNGELRCIAEDYGVPKCKGDSISVVDDYGFVCEPLTNKPEEPEEEENPPNTDTDGDGEPDEYQRENDPDAVNKGLDKVVDAINEGNRKTDTSNQHLGNIENAVKDIANNVGALKQMGENGELGGGGGGGSGGGGEGLKNDQGEDYLSDLADIKENTKNTADGIADLNEQFEAPDEGFNTEGLLGIPTLTETASSFSSAVLGHELIQSVSGLTDIPSQTTCPVWTIPATDYWQAIPMNIHCDILEEYRGTFSVIFMFFWTGIAIYAFLRA
ncbi:hypothetical protein NLU14_06630 [Marinobacter sp. 71-i]|uniref:Uncharacterized protein n=1 Tax=Marinobacter iranensis TaxID=2962607 RepID=A0ABT5Y8A0_9GAMM|nr:hypothetical protein [Marinobacter iranensis]MDF0749902.1 hypothetical protein [Marinobacter iranensis]